MIQFLRDLLAAPFRVLALLFGFVPVLDPLVFYHIAWRLSKDADTAKIIIFRTYQRKGLDAADALADTLIRKCPDAAIAVSICGLIMNQTGDAVRTQAWIDKARSLDCRNEALLLLADIMVADKIQPEHVESIVETILLRNDLPGVYTQIALLQKAEICMQKQQWEQAKAIVDRINQIDNSGTTQWFYKMLEFVQQQQQDNTTLPRLYEQACGSPNDLVDYAVLNWYLGNHEAALAAVRTAREQGLQDAEIWKKNSGFARFIASHDQTEELI